MKRNIKALSVLLAISALLPLFSFSAYAAPLSPAIDILSYNSQMIKTGLTGYDIEFSSNDFRRATGISSFDYITVNTLPRPEEGTLSLGTSTVKEGQKIYTSTLSYLKFAPQDSSVTNSAFTFALPERFGETPITCTVKFTDKINYAPTCAEIGIGRTEIKTYKNIPVSSSLHGEDKENDALTYRIVSYPKKGTVSITNRETGEYTYTPMKNKTGKDSFSYTVSDSYGNFSEPIKVKVTIDRNRKNISFSDMKNHPAYSSAITMASIKIMSGETLKDKTFFSPAAAVTRGEFISMISEMCGLKENSDAAKVFSDFENTEEKYLPYIGAAYEAGLIKGIKTESGVIFDADKNITKAEALSIISSAVGLDMTAPVSAAFDENDSLPAWAAASVSAAYKAGIYHTVGNTDLSSTLNRGDCAMFLSEAVKMIEN